MSYFFAVVAYASPFSIFFSFLYFSDIFLVFSFRLEQATFNILITNVSKNKILNKMVFSIVRSFESF